MLIKCGFGEKAALSDINFSAMLIGASIHDKIGRASCRERV